MQELLDPRIQNVSYLVRRNHLWCPEAINTHH